MPSSHEGICSLLSACCSQELEGSVLYGLRIPLGSNMALKRCIRQTASLGLLYRMNCFFLKPSPCSALMLPLYLAVHSYTNGSMASSREWLYDSAVTFKCKFPSPGRKHCRGGSARKTPWPCMETRYCLLHILKQRCLCLSLNRAKKTKFIVLLQTPGLSMHK